MYNVDFSLVEKKLIKLPGYIKNRALLWATLVEEHGLEVVRKTPGYHDEPLKGKLFGLRSVRLNRAYRLLYKIEKGTIVKVIVVGVNKHEY